MGAGLGVGVAFFQIGGAFGAVGLGPGLDFRACLQIGDGVGKLQGRGRRVRPDAEDDREVAADGGRLQFDLDDVGGLVDVVVGIEGRVEAEAGAERQDYVGLLGKARGDGIAARGPSGRRSGDGRTGWRHRGRGR